MNNMANRKQTIKKISEIMEILSNTDDILEYKVEINKEDEGKTGIIKLNTCSNYLHWDSIERISKLMTIPPTTWGIEISELSNALVIVIEWEN